MNAERLQFVKAKVAEGLQKIAHLPNSDTPRVNVAEALLNEKMCEHAEGLCPLSEVRGAWNNFVAACEEHGTQAEMFG